MKRPMIFKQSYYDAQPLSDRQSYSFFSESDEEDESVSLMSEDQAIKWLFSSFSFDRFFIEDFFQVPNRVKSFFGLKEPFIIKGKKPGDIDILLVDTERPERAIAFECKRVKSQSIDKTNSKVNNANGIRKGVLQANGYQSLGFHQSYLMIILLDDGRKLDYTNPMMRNSKSDDVEEIYDIPWNENLNKDVGIVFVKVTQPTGKHYNLMGGQGFCIDKVAGKLDQLPAMTNKIKELLKQQGC
jgi:hypothetical protein